jgi:hypothetical protein
MTSMSEDRLFVPLNKKWYDLFKAGTKLWEIRAVSPRFNHKTVYTGRTVELRRGYAVKGALWGRITDVAEMRDIYHLPAQILAEALPIDESEKALWNEIDSYNTKYDRFIAFKVKLFLSLSSLKASNTISVPGGFALSSSERRHVANSVDQNRELLQKLAEQ